MGTTLVALLFSGGRLGLLHIGDSRCYLLRDGELSQITHDHTLVQELQDAGKLSAEDASSHPQRSVITRVLDGRGDVDPDLSVREARVGDRYLVCSDGLTGPVASLDTLKEALSLPDPQDSCDRLVQLALRGGGPDNITVVVADVVSEEVPPTQPVVAGAAAEAPQEAPPGIADSPASRARVAEGRDTPPPARAHVHAAPAGRSRRTALLLLLAVVLLLAGGVAGWAYVQHQYFVGFDDDHVVVFRGVEGDLAGLPFHRVESRTDLARDSLSEIEQERLDDGIPAADEQDARQIVQRLLDSVAACAAAATPQPTPQATPQATPAATPRATASPAPTPASTPSESCS
jgi:protein phosphatase